MRWCSGSDDEWGCVALFGWSALKTGQLLRTRTRRCWLAGGPGRSVAHQGSSCDTGGGATVVVRRCEGSGSLCVLCALRRARQEVVLFERVRCALSFGCAGALLCSAPASAQIIVVWSDLSDLFRRRARSIIYRPLWSAHHRPSSRSRQPG